MMLMVGWWKLARKEMSDWELGSWCFEVDVDRMISVGTASMGTKFSDRGLYPTLSI